VASASQSGQWKWKSLYEAAVLECDRDIQSIVVPGDMAVLHDDPDWLLQFTKLATTLIVVASGGARSSVARQLDNSGPED